MVETLLIIQTIAIIAILIILVYALQTLKKEVERAIVQIKDIEKHIVPALDETKELLQTANKFMCAVGSCAQNTAQIIEKVRNAATSLDSALGCFKSSVIRTRSRASILKVGLVTGITSLVSYCINKNKEDII